MLCWLNYVLDLDRIRRRNHPSVVSIATGRGGSTGDLKFVSSADCSCKGVGRGGVDGFFTTVGSIPRLLGQRKFPNCAVLLAGTTCPPLLLAGCLILLGCQNCDGGSRGRACSA